MVLEMNRQIAKNEKDRYLKMWHVWSFFSEDK